MFITDDSEIKRKRILLTSDNLYVNQVLDTFTALNNQNWQGQVSCRKSKKQIATTLESLSSKYTEPVFTNPKLAPEQVIFDEDELISQKYKADRHKYSLKNSANVFFLKSQVTKELPKNKKANKVFKIKKS